MLIDIGRGVSVHEDTAFQGVVHRGRAGPVGDDVEMKAAMAISGRHWNAPDISATSAVPVSGARTVLRTGPPCRARDRREAAVRLKSRFR